MSQKNGAPDFISAFEKRGWFITELQNDLYLASKDAFTLLVFSGAAPNKYEDFTGFSLLNQKNPKRAALNADLLFGHQLLARECLGAISHSK